MWYVEALTSACSLVPLLVPEVGLLVACPVVGGGVAVAASAGVAALALGMMVPQTPVLLVPGLCPPAGLFHPFAVPSP